MKKTFDDWKRKFKRKNDICIIEHSIVDKLWKRKISIMWKRQIHTIEIHNRDTENGKSP